MSVIQADNKIILLIVAALRCNEMKGFDLMKKSKRHILSIALFAMMVPTVLCSCGMVEPQTEGADISDSVSIEELEPENENLKNENENLKNENEQLRKRMEEMMNLPDILVSTVDDRNQVVELPLYSSLEAAEENCSYIYSLGRSYYTLAITMNGNDTWDKISIISRDGTIEDANDSRYAYWHSETLNNVTTVSGHFYGDMETLVITVGETMYYASMVFTPVAA